MSSWPSGLLDCWVSGLLGSCLSGLLDSLVLGFRGSCLFFAALGSGASLLSWVSGFFWESGFSEVLGLWVSGFLGFWLCGFLAFEDSCGLLVGVCGLLVS